MVLHFFYNSTEENRPEASTIWPRTICGAAKKGAMVDGPQWGGRIVPGKMAGTGTDKNGHFPTKPLIDWFCIQVPEFIFYLIFSGLRVAVRAQKIHCNY